MYEIVNTTIKMARGDTIYFDQVLVDMYGNVRELNEYDETGKQLTNNIMKFYLSTTPIQEPNKVSQTKVDENGSPIIEPPDSLILQKTFTDRYICLEPDDTRYLRTGCYYYRTVAYFEEIIVKDNNDSNDNEDNNEDNDNNNSGFIEKYGLIEEKPKEPPKEPDEDNNDKNDDNKDNEDDNNHQIVETPKIIKYIHPQTVSAGKLYLIF